MIAARICRNGHFTKGDGPCLQCRPDTDNKSPLFPNGVQIGMIDGEQEGYFPPGFGPYVDYPRSLKRRLKNNRAWKEGIKRSEGKYGDIS